MRSRMTLIPKLFSHWWETLEHPHRLIDQHFARGMRPEEFFPPWFYEKLPFRSSPFHYNRPLSEWIRESMDSESGWSVVKDDKDKFHVALNVQHFKPEEVNVKLVDDYIVVEGKHEEKQDDHGIVSRHFVRKYLVPEQCDPELATSALSSDGILTITAPRKPEAVEAKHEKSIKIEHTGKPAIENDPEQAKQKQ